MHIIHLKYLILILLADTMIPSVSRMTGRASNKLSVTTLTNGSTDNINNGSQLQHYNNSKGVLVAWVRLIRLA